MTDDIVSELSELQRQASALQGLIAAAEANAPRSAEGADPTGTVFATIGADGLPASIWVQDGWQRRLSGRAVRPGRGRGVRRRGREADGRLEQRARGRRLAIHSGQNPGRRGPGRPGPDGGPADPAGQRSTRGLDDLLNEVLTAFDHVDDVAATSAITAQGSGVSGYHKLAVRVSPAGLVSCEVDAAWAAQQSADVLIAAFAEALARAKADLAVQVAADPARKLDGVLGDALSLLGDPQRLAQS